MDLMLELHDLLLYNCACQSPQGNGECPGKDKLPMAAEKVGIYSKWLGSVPKDKQGNPIPKSEWPKKRPRRWVVRWFSTDSQSRYGKVFETRKEAERYASDLQTQVHAGKGDRPKTVTLDSFIAEHQEVMKGQVALATLQDQVRALRLFKNFIGGAVKLTEIHSRNAEAFIASRLKVVAVETANKDIRTLKSIFNLAINPRGYLHEGQNPFAHIKERKTTEKEVRYVPAEDYRKLLNAASDNWWKAVISIAYGSGLRRNEILHLTWPEIDFENQRIRLVAKRDSQAVVRWETKGRKNRVVPMSEETSNLLAAIQAESPEGHPYVFLSSERLKIVLKRRKHDKWDERSAMINNISRDFAALCHRAGIEECVLHDLRRSAITNWAQKLPIQVVQVLAGHSNISTTRKYYLSVREEDFDTACALVNQLCRV